VAGKTAEAGLRNLPEAWSDDSNPPVGQPSGESPQALAMPSGERMSDEERQRRIAMRAYQKAQERGFRGDRQLEDWLEAEREHNEGS
jgi:hypothetical protein